MRKNGLLANSLMLMASVIISRIAGLILKIPLTNLLGGIGMGYYQSAYTVFTPLYSIFASSLGPTVSSLAAEFFAYKRLDKIKQVKSASLKYILPCSFLVMMIQLLFSDFIAKRIIGNPEAKHTIAIIAPCIAIGTATAIYRGYFEGLGKMTPTALSQALEAIVRTFCGLSFTVMAISYFGSANDFTTPYIAAAAIFGVTVSDLFGLIFIYLCYRSSPDSKLLERESPSKKETFITFKRMYSMMMPITLASVVSGLMNSIDLSTIILSIKSSLRSSPELYAKEYKKIIDNGVSLFELPNFLYGSYSGLVMTVFSLIPSLCSVFGKSALPIIASLYAKGEQKVLEKEAKRVISIVSLISVPSSLGLMIFSEEVLKILFSSRTAEISVCVTPLMILCPAIPLLSLTSACFSMMQSIGKQLEPIKITTLATAVKLALNLLFISHLKLGLSGASCSTLICYFVTFCLSLKRLKSELKLKTSLIKTVLKYLAPSVLSVAAAKILFQIIKNSASIIGKSAILVGFVIVIAVILYLILLLLLDIYTKNSIKKEIFQ